jgi:hypothetical protein
MEQSKEAEFVVPAAPPEPVDYRLNSTRKCWRAAQAQKEQAARERVAEEEAARAEAVRLKPGRRQFPSGARD